MRFAIRFGVFARGKPCVGIARAKSSEKSNPCSASGAVVPEMQHADDDCLITGKSTPTGC